MDRLIIENVRCFRGRHEVPLAPLTILVGENSTGKSTLLAMARLAWDLETGSPLNFNEEPFRLGAYDQIASSLGTRKGTERRFTIGIDSQITIRKQRVQARLTGEFISRKDQPALDTWRFEAEPFRVEAKHDENEDFFSLWAKDSSGFVEVKREDIGFAPGRIGLNSAASVLVSEQIDRNLLLSIFFAWRVNRGPRPYAFAPIRTSPQRTYDPVKEIVDPEGGHVPMVLAGLHSRSPREWRLLKAALEDFGKASGLFAAVDVRRLGKGSSDPFQLQVRINEASINLVDVGYGVSQILPILVDCLRSENGRNFLLQQPEVHLHPKAQAELGSFLAFLAKREKKKFLLETHSDYLVDRIRMDIRDGKNGLQPEDVSLLYFEREEGSVKIHRLMLDKFGNIENAPPGYRKFILEEERRFLGI